VNALERGVRRLDRFQQRHAVPAFAFAVVQKYGNDRAGAQATRIAYQGLFSLFPLLLLLTTILGYLLHGDPTLREQILDSTLANFPIIGTQLKATSGLQGNGLALLVGIAGTIYGSFGIGQAAQSAMNLVWNIPYVEWPNFLKRRLRSVAVVAAFGLAMLATAGLSIVASAWATGFDRPLALVGSAAITLAMFTGAFMILTAEPLGWRDVFLGAVLATVFWVGLQLLGAWYVTRVLNNASDTYGFFAIVIALLSWMYLAAKLTLLAAEINVVRKYRLWPRSMTQPPLIDGDRRTFERLARMEIRRPEYGVEMELNPSADEDPLESEDQDAAGERASRVGGGSRR
jgi:YihY family inner membrane protein